MIKKAFIYIIIGFFLNSCQIFIEPMPKTWNWGARPRPLTGVRGFPEADTMYGKAFKDGCEYGFESSAKGLISDTSQAFFDYKSFKKSTDYGTGWWDGFEQCVYIFDHDVL